MAFPITLPLDKLSSATNSNIHQKPIPWTHSNDPHNCLTMQNERRVDNYASFAGQTIVSMVLKIKQRDNLLETVEIGELARQSAMAARMCRSNGYEPRLEDHVLAAVVKSPRLALRFKLRDGQIRRLQFCFRSHGDFEMLRAALEQMSVYGSVADPRSSEPNNVRATAQTGIVANINMLGAYNSDRPFTAPTPFTVTHGIRADIVEGNHGSQAGSQNAIVGRSHWKNVGPPQQQSTLYQSFANTPLPTACSQPSLPSSTRTEHLSYADSHQPGSQSALISSATATTQLSRHYDMLRYPQTSAGEPANRPATAPESWDSPLAHALPPRRLLPFGSARDTSDSTTMTVPVSGKRRKSVEVSTDEPEPKQVRAKGATKRQPLAEATSSQINARASSLRSHGTRSHTAQSKAAIPAPDIQTVIKDTPPLSRSDAVSGDDSWLEAYVKKSREERQTVMDDLITSSLNDPNFLTFCEDLQENWRRIEFDA